MNKGLKEFESFLQKTSHRSDPLFKAMSFGLPMPRKVTYNALSSKDRNKFRGRKQQIPGNNQMSQWLHSRLINCNYNKV